jgi:hypothetical protein
MADALEDGVPVIKTGDLSRPHTTQEGRPRKAEEEEEKAKDPPDNIRQGKGFGEAINANKLREELENEQHKERERKKEEGKGFAENIKTVEREMEGEKERERQGKEGKEGENKDNELVAHPQNQPRPRDNQQHDDEAMKKIHVQKQIDALDLDYERKVLELKQKEIMKEMLINLIAQQKLEIDNLISQISNPNNH